MEINSGYCKEGFVKIACILGSPRKNGSSAAIAGRLALAAERLGAESETFVLNESEFSRMSGMHGVQGEG